MNSARMVLCLAIALTASANLLRADTLELSLETASQTALDDVGRAREELSAALSGSFPLGESRSRILETFNHLRAAAYRYETIRGDRVGDAINVRECSGTTNKVVNCFWFLFVPPDRREAAMNEGIYGFTWILRFTFADDDTLNTMGIDLLVERL
jgi:hypothetical protein